MAPGACDTWMQNWKGLFFTGLSFNILDSKTYFNILNFIYTLFIYLFIFSKVGSPPARQPLLEGVLIPGDAFEMCERQCGPFSILMGYISRFKDNRCQHHTFSSFCSFYLFPPSSCLVLDQSLSDAHTGVLTVVSPH